GKLEALKSFFDRNKIRYGSITGNALRGYNYFSGREESFNASNSLAVSAYQPKSALVKVLFEPKSKLSDSVTYDITAWSLPFVYGLQTYAVKEKLPVTGNVKTNDAVAVSSSAYGYLINYNSFADAKFLSALLN